MWDRPWDCLASVSEQTGGGSEVRYACLCPYLEPEKKEKIGIPSAPEGYRGRHSPQTTTKRGAVQTKGVGDMGANQTVDLKDRKSLEESEILPKLEVT
jgi:hypothetical protein